MHPDRFQRPYAFVKAWAQWGLKRYFRKLQVVNYERYVPREGALFIAANHQNAFLDPVIISATSKKYHQTNFITRSDVFNPITDRIFKLLKMVPIYRQRDGGSEAIRKNEEMFQVYTDLLLEEEAFTIFVEGDHGRKRRLRPLRKGIGRIAHQTLEEANYDLAFHIVPAGLHYHDHDRFYSDMLLVYGPPIDLAAYHELFQQQPAKAINQLRADLTAAMREVMIDIRHEAYYPLIDQLRAWMAPDLAKAQHADPSDLYDVFLAEKDLIAALEDAAEREDPVIERLDAEVKGYRMKLRINQLSDETVAEGAMPQARLVQESVVIGLTAPLFAYGYLNHLPLVLLAKFLPPSLVKDPVYTPSIRFALGIFVTPLLYLLQTLVVGSLAGWGWGLLYLLSLLPTGSFAVHYWHRVKRWRERRRFAELVREGEQVLRSARLRLVDTLKGLVQAHAERSRRVREEEA